MYKNLEKIKDDFPIYSVGIAIEIYSNANYNSILGNNITKSYEYGIVIYYSHNNIFKGNNIISGGEEGLILYNSNRNRIVGNNISWNHGVGVCAIRSSKNYIFHNNIFSNTEDGYDDMIDNFWYMGYPISGNFWGYHFGIDNNSGPYQDLPGSDGIYDLPYSITENGVDLYPFVLPLYEIEVVINNDRDEDGMDDSWEKKHNLNSSWKNDRYLDPDFDGLRNIEEFGNKTDPHDKDSDNDGLSDSDEVELWNTNPNDPDMDGDGFDDGDEINKKTDPFDDEDFPILDRGDPNGPVDAKTEKNDEDPLFSIYLLIILIIFILSIFVIIKILIGKHRE